ncbi:hypothetical protein [Cytobacillus gottheilii]|uniref:hypothetical protein n=1 Tax=Cytobacillus gottheilii TaxID=859144 RepID=UPI0009BC4438|nr:hypothetical protein [Cytobacillus gottheilii]
MKRLSAFILTILCIYAIYFDLTSGTLPNQNEEIAVEASAANQEAGLEYFEKEVGPGETVLTIIEAQLGGPVPVAIDTVVSDFQTLNTGIQPEQIQNGKTYKFPSYK